MQVQVSTVCACTSICTLRQQRKTNNRNAPYLHANHAQRNLFRLISGVRKRVACMQKMRTISRAVRDTEPCRLIGYYLCRSIRIGNLNEHIPTYVPTPAVAILPTNPGRKSLMQVMMTPDIIDKVCTFIP